MIGGGEGICGTAGRGRSLIVRGGLVSAVSELPGLTHKEALTHPLGIIVVHPRVCGEHFLAAQTQWRYTFGVRIGLDYASAKIAVKRAGYKFKDVFAGLQVMEREVLTASDGEE